MQFWDEKWTPLTVRVAQAWRRAATACSVTCEASTATGALRAPTLERPRSDVKGSTLGGEDDSSVTSSLKCSSASVGSHPELMEFFESVRDFELSISQLTGM